MDCVLRLSDEQRQQIAAWAASAYPHEGCGLLLGRREGSATRVVEVRAARNIRSERARDRYEIDPADYLAAETAARAAGIEVVGIWHSHPDHPARPSPTDREFAWAGWSYLIAAVAAAGVTELRAWRLNGGGRFEEEEIRS
jgi:proteasome lid subunit RPN8/RPN11